MPHALVEIQISKFFDLRMIGPRMSDEIFHREKVGMNPTVSPRKVSLHIRPKIKTNQSAHAQQHVSSEFADHFA